MTDTLFTWIATTAKVLIVFVFMLQMVPILIWLERKIVAWLQMRVGPNRVGPFGLLQPLADAVKLIAKENVFPSGVDKITYYLAPIISIAPALMSFAVVPFGDPVTIMGREVKLQVADVNIGILYILALSSLAVYGVTLAGWSSNNKYSLLGGLRASAQMISYEIPIGLSIVTVVLLTGSLSMVDMVRVQQENGLWNMFPQLIAFILFVICSNAELNRAPFDMAEAESELVAGFHTEYTGFRFAMFFMGEYVNMITISAVATILFLGGWTLPFGWQNPWLGLLWFIVKIFAFIVFYMVIRATLPRVRYDQLMAAGWKIMIPIALINLAVTAVVLTFWKAQAIYILTVANVIGIAVGLLVYKVFSRKTAGRPGVILTSGTAREISA